MKTVLLIALVVYSVVAANVSNSPGKYGKIFSYCTNRAGISADELREFKEKSGDWPLTEEEQSFVCCMVGEASLVKDKSVNMLCVQRLFSQQSLDAGMNITKAVTECSSTGIESNNLVTCYQEATFFRCLFDKMQIQLSSIESNSECHID